MNFSVYISVKWEKWHRVCAPLLRPSILDARTCTFAHQFSPRWYLIHSETVCDKGRRHLGTYQGANMLIDQRLEINRPQACFSVIIASKPSAHPLTFSYVRQNDDLQNWMHRGMLRTIRCASIITKRYLFSGKTTVQIKRTLESGTYNIVMNYLFRASKGAWLMPLYQVSVLKRKNKPW